MTRDPSNPNRRLPIWLRDVPLPPRPAAAAGATEAAAPANWMDSLRSPAPAPETGSALPEWLRDLADDEDTPAAPPAEEVPPWLQATDATAEETAVSTPDWLRGATADEPTTPAAEDVPDWLRGISDATPAAGDNAEAPSWLQGSEETAPAADEPGAVPPWLQGSEEPFAASAETPSWLQGSEEPLAASAETPSWLQGSEEPLAAAPDAPAEAPSWLQGLAGDLPQDAAAAPRAEDSTESDTEAEEATPPDVAGWFEAIDSDEVRRVMESGDEDADVASVEPFSFDIGDESQGASASTSAAPSPFAFGHAGDADDENAIPDWLSGSAESATASGAAPVARSSGAPDDAGDDVPAWLRDIGAELPDRPELTPEEDVAPLTATPAAEAHGAPSTGDDIPEWLREAGQAAAEPAAEDVPAWLRPADAAATPAEGVPAWLQEPEGAAAPTAGSGGADLPDWLAAAAETPAPAAEREGAAAPATGGGEDLPAWLRPADAAATPAEGVAAWVQEPVGAAAPAAGRGGAELPDWLAAAAETPAPAAERGGADLPDWLAPKAGAAPAGSADLPPWLRDESGRPLPTSGAPGDANLPPWLQGAPTAPVAATAGIPPAVEKSELDWFDDEAAAPAERERAPASEGGFLGGVDVPAWLQAEPAKPAEPTPDDARSLDWLRKIGAPEEDSAPIITPAAPRLAPPRAATRTAAQIEALALLRTLAAEPFPATAPVPQAAPATVWQRVGLERVFYLLLLLGLIVGLVVPEATAGVAGAPEAPGVGVLQSRIDALGENDIVLVAYEWDVRRVAEMRPLERAVFDHLTARRAKIVLVSTDPQGALLQFDALDRLTEAQYQPGGQDYVLLGYRPGGDLALRLMAQDFRAALRSDFQGEDATIGALATDTGTGEPRLRTLRDFAHVIVLADDVVDVQGWMEQIYPTLGSAAGRVPLTFLLPTEAAPIVQPYTRQQGVMALIGQQGALAYEAGRGAERGAAAGATAAKLRFALLVLIVLLLAGAVIVGIDEALKRRRRA